MNKTDLTILLARERVKAQTELLSKMSNGNPELANLVRGINLYDHALTEAVKQIGVATPKKSNGNHSCWFCGKDGHQPTMLGGSYHPYMLCMICGATTTDNELHPYHAKLYLPYKKLAQEVGRLLGDARRAKLPPGVYQKSLPVRCQ